MWSPAARLPRSIEANRSPVSLLEPPLPLPVNEPSKYFVPSTSTKASENSSDSYSEVWNSLQLSSRVAFAAELMLKVVTRPASMSRMSALSMLPTLIRATPSLPTKTTSPEV